MNRTVDGIEENDDFGLSLFNAKPDDDLLRRFEQGDLNSLALDILNAMHLLGGNTRCVTREKIGTKKGYSKVMVALVATRQLRLAFKKGKTHFYSLPDSVVCACDFETPTSTRIKATTYRILRNTALSQRIKLLHQNRCQICGFSIQLPDGTAYSEAHHIKPLGTPHDGPDIEQNIIVLCPNHHAMCDYGVVPLDIERLRSHEIHQVGVEFVLYHNSEIYVGSELDSS